MQILLTPAEANLDWLLENTGRKEALHADPRDISFSNLKNSGAKLDLFVPGQEPADALILVPDHNRELHLRVIVDVLLGPFGCPWDKEQTHESLTKHLIEEAYEFVDAVESGRVSDMTEELGDVFLQPYMHTQIAHRAARFDQQEPLVRITEKLIRRHPHVFSSLSVAGSEEVLKNWDAIKKAEKGDPEATSVLAGIPKAMPALSRALAVSKRAARCGFEWEKKEDVMAKLHEELAEYSEAVEKGDPAEIQSELGDILFTVVNLARWDKVDPEEALRRMLDRFTQRFQLMESASDRPLGELSPEDWDALWVAAKAKLEQK